MRGFITKIKRSRSGKVLLLIAFSMVMLMNFMLIDGTSKSSQISTQEADALYGGVSDLVSYPYAGYIIDYSAFFSRQVCGITMLSEDIGVSAAHCFVDDGYFYTGLGDISTEPARNYPVIKYELDENWDENTLSGDVALVGVENVSEELDQFAVIATPAVGCSYEVLAYGSTDQDVLSSADLRRKAQICIDRVSDDRIYISSDEGGICFGDSGSPIFIKGTNKVVGIVSAITADNNEYSEDNCFINNTAVATRLDTSLNFLASDSEVTDELDCPSGSENVCADDEKCLSNECRRPGSFNYTSTLDYRSIDYILGGYFGLALVVIFLLITFLFIYLIYRSFTTYN